MRRIYQIRTLFRPVGQVMMFPLGEGMLLSGNIFCVCHKVGVRTISTLNTVLSCLARTDEESGEHFFFERNHAFSDEIIIPSDVFPRFLDILHKEVNSRHSTLLKELDEDWDGVQPEDCVSLKTFFGDRFYRYSSYSDPPFLGKSPVVKQLEEVGNEAGYVWSRIGGMSEVGLPVLHMFEKGLNHFLDRGLPREIPEQWLFLPCQTFSPSTGTLYWETAIPSNNPRLSAGKDFCRWEAISYPVAGFPVVDAEFRNRVLDSVRSFAALFPERFIDRSSGIEVAISIAKRIQMLEINGIDVNVGQLIEATNQEIADFITDFWCESETELNCWDWDDVQNLADFAREALSSMEEDWRVFQRFEFFRGYDGGDFSGTGEFAYIPVPFCDLHRQGDDYRPAFSAWTGLESSWVIHTCPDHLYVRYGEGKYEECEL